MLSIHFLSFLWCSSTILLYTHIHISILDEFLDGREWDIICAPHFFYRHYYVYLKICSYTTPYSYTIVNISFHVIIKCMLCILHVRVFYKASTTIKYTLKPMKISHKNMCYRHMSMSICFIVYFNIHIYDLSNPFICELFIYCFYIFFHN